MTFPEIESARVRAGLSCRQLAIAAGVHPFVYYRARLGHTAPTGRTLARLRKALVSPRRIKAQPVDLAALILATFRGWASHFATKLGVDVEMALGSDPQLRANASEAWRRAARVRELAVYCTVTELDLAGAVVARAIGVTRAGVSLMLRRVEDAREDKAIDAMIEAAAKLISGRAG